MANEAEPAVAGVWKTSHVYGMAATFLVLGLALGYLFRGSASAPIPVASTASAAPASTPEQMPSLDDMKRMADKQAEPLLTKLKTDPKNSQLLNQVGLIYKATHQFKAATEYFQRAVDADPKNVGARTDLASCLYYEGDTDGALSQLQQSLAYDPKDANSLFNLGMIRLQAKKDPAGAVSAWQQLLKLNPKISCDKKASVERLIAQARKNTLSE